MNFYYSCLNCNDDDNNNSSTTNIMKASERRRMLRYVRNNHWNKIRHPFIDYSLILRILHIDFLLPSACLLHCILH